MGEREGLLMGTGLGVGGDENIIKLVMVMVVKLSIY